MKTVWTKGLDSDAIEEMRGSYTSAHLTRKRLITLVEGKIAESENLAHLKEGYDCPNWAYKQADLMGYRRALHEIISLIS